MHQVDGEGGVHQSVMAMVMAVSVCDGDGDGSIKL